MRRVPTMRVPRQRRIQAPSDLAGGEPVGRDADEFDPRGGCRPRRGRERPAAGDELQQGVGLAMHRAPPLEAQERGRQLAERRLEPLAIEHGVPRVEDAVEQGLVVDGWRGRPRRRWSVTRGHAEQLTRHHRLDRRHDPQARLQGGEPGERAGVRRGVDQIDLVEQEEVGGLDLPPDGVAQARVVEQTHHALHVGQHDHGVERQLRLDERDLGDRPGIADAAGFYEHVVEGLRRVEDADHGRQEVVGHAAADATVGEAQRLAVMRQDQVGIDVDRPEIVDEDGDAFPRRREQAVDERGLARPEEATDHRQRDPAANRRRRHGFDASWTFGAWWTSGA